MARFARVLAFAFPLVLTGTACALAQNNAPPATNTPATNTPAANAPATASAPAAPTSDLLATVTLDDLRDAVLNGGYRAQVKQDTNGDYIASASGGQNFFISLGGCDDKKVCKSILFETGGWTPKTPLTVDALDKFHSDNAGWVGVVKYSDGKYYGDYRVAIVGGVTKAWLQYNVEAFATTTEDFAAFMQK